MNQRGEAITAAYNSIQKISRSDKTSGFFILNTYRIIYNNKERFRFWYFYPLLNNSFNPTHENVPIIKIF